MTTTDFDDYDEDYTWSSPLPDGARHAMPGDDGRVPCCGVRWDALPNGDWTTAGADRVTCLGVSS